MNNNPPVVFATARPEEVWRAYIGERIKVRELNNGLMQVAVDGGGWQYVEES